MENKDCSRYKLQSHEGDKYDFKNSTKRED